MQACSFLLQRLARSIRHTGVALALLNTAGAALAIEAIAPQVDTSSLPEQARQWAEINPVRGNPDAIAIGKSAFNQSCAKCHGADANASRSPAPDLRRIGLACKRVREPELQQRCMSDADAFFVKSVRYGKQKFGIIHMPPWEGIIAPEVVWAMRSFVETAPK